MTTNASLTGRLIAAGMMALLMQSSQAAVTAEEAKQLGTSLTEFGAEQAGNADGSIPAYTGGLEKVAGYDAGKLLRVAQVDSFPSYGTGGINLNGWTNYDLVKGGYYLFNVGYAGAGRHIHEYESAEGLSIALTPQSIVGSSAQ